MRSHSADRGSGLEPLEKSGEISNQSPKLAPVLKDAKRRVLETLLTRNSRC